MADVKVDDKKVDDKVADKKVDDKKVQSPEELRAEIETELKKSYEADADRRVTEAIKKNTAKLKAENDEVARLAKLSDEEKQKELSEKVTREQIDRERNLTTKELKLNLIDILTEKELDLGFRELIDVSSLIDIDETKRGDLLAEKVTGFKKIFDALVDKKVGEVKKEFLKGGTPDKLGDKEVKIPKTTYDKAKESGDVKSMIAEKMRLRAEALNKK